MVCAFLNLDHLDQKDKIHLQKMTAALGAQLKEINHPALTDIIVDFTQPIPNRQQIIQLVSLFLLFEFKRDLGCKEQD
jgi:hypothetical protein